MAGIKRKTSVYRFIATTLLVLVLLVLVIMYHASDLSRRREIADVYPCQANLMQFGLAVMEYEQDHDSKLPGGNDHWAGQLFQYIKSYLVYRCPQDDLSPEPALSGATMRYPISYAVNANLMGHSSSALCNDSLTVFAIDFASQKLVAFDHPERVSPYTDGVMPNAAWGDIRLGTTSAVNDPPRHDPSVIFVACDAHIRMLRPEMVSSGADNPLASGEQDSTHAAGTTAVSGKTARYKLTFSER